MTSPSSYPGRGRGLRLVTRTLVTAATAAAFVGMASVSASAAPGDTATDSVVANVNVDSTITLAVNQTDFELAGDPSSTVAGPASVTGTVTTNNITGYSVGVQAATATLVAASTGNTDSIPIGNLSVESAAGVETPVSNTAPVITTTKATRSALVGDTFSDDYSVNIPNVNSDIYRVTLNYTATALA